MEKLKLLEFHCEQLKSQLAGAHKIAQMFALAAVESITGIRTEEKEELKAPKTELISKLHIGIRPTTKEQSPLAVILERHNGELPAKDLWQRYGGEIGAFYQQLKVEIARGWVLEPEVAEMRTVEAP
jgi:type I restriction enzyme S subunit